MRRLERAGGGGIDRRGFLAALPALALAAGCAREGAAGDGPDEASSAAPGASTASATAVGVQLYTLRSLMAEDVEGTLAAVAEIGYEEVELAGLWGRAPAAFRALLDGVGLRAASSHHGLGEIRGGWQATLDGANALGQSWVVCPSIDGSDRTPDGLRAVADEFNGAGEAARAAGLRFGYHNHDWEFAPLEDGTIPYDLLLERCDASLVAMQMDLFWTVHGGRDPHDYFAAHPGRFTSVHVKDRTPEGEMVAVGRGVIDFESVVGAASAAGIQHWFVEHDRPADPLEDVRFSFQTLRGLLP